MTVVSLWTFYLRAWLQNLAGQFIRRSGCSISLNSLSDSLSESLAAVSCWTFQKVWLRYMSVQFVPQHGVSALLHSFFKSRLFTQLAPPSMTDTWSQDQSTVDTLLHSLTDIRLFNELREIWAPPSVQFVCLLVA